MAAHHTRASTYLVTLILAESDFSGVISAFTDERVSAGEHQRSLARRKVVFDHIDDQLDAARLSARASAIEIKTARLQFTLVKSQASKSTSRIAN